MRWKETIDIKEAWDNLNVYGDYIPVAILKSFIENVKAKMSTYLNDSSLEYAFIRMDQSVEDANATFANLEAFNFGWNLLYDWADSNKIWIKTFF